MLAKDEMSNWLSKERTEAEKSFQSMKVPGLRDENYKFTPVKESLISGQKDTSTADPAISYQKDSNKQLYLAQSEKALSELDRLPKQLEVSESMQEDFFQKLNAGRWTDGVYLYLKEGQAKVELKQDFSKHQHLRNYIWLAPYTELDLEDFIFSDQSDEVLTTAYTKIFLEHDSVLRLKSFQDLDKNLQAFHRLDLVLQGNARVSHYGIALGASKSQNRTEISLMGKEAEYQGQQAVIGYESQHFDFWVKSFHPVPHTQSHLKFTNIVDGRAKSVFNANIDILKEGFKTEASQSVKSLLLSPRASVENMPKLEIATDDVKVAHGAAVSSIDENQRFYLQTRGISKEQAERMIVESYIEPILREFSNNTVVREKAVSKSLSGK